MTRALHVAGFIALLLALAAPHLRSQQPALSNAPRASYVYPAGLQRGTTTRVTVVGQFLDGVADVLLSSHDVRASVVTIDKPLTQREITDLRDQMQALQPKVGADPALRVQLLAMRARLNDSLERNRNPVFSDRVTIEISASDRSAPGLVQLRLRTAAGLSNPLNMAVGQLPEARERDVKVTAADAELSVTLPVTVNGRLIPGDIDTPRQPARQPNQYAPGDVDRYRFQARQGADLVVTVSARELMPYLADAVPGWLQAVVTLVDANGHEVGFCDDYKLEPDPVLHYHVPADGEYVLAIRDAIYRGRQDFVYRISVGELPFITSIFPLGGPAGGKTTVELTGWNLPTARTTVTAGRLAETISVGARNGDVESNRVPFAVGTDPERLEREPNNTTKDAQPLSLPAIVNGRIQQPGDWDVFSFKGRRGDVILAEVEARSLQSPLDSVLQLTDAAGRPLTTGDDREDKTLGLLTRQADAYLITTLPADGQYFVRLGDIQRAGGVEFAYRLRLGQGRPDFDLRVTPSSINALGAANVPILVTAIRRDGFAGEIALSFKDGPEGLTTSGALIPAGQDQVWLTISAAPIGTRDPVTLHLEGRAQIDGQTVVRSALPADDRMQAFASHHLVPADQLRLTVSGRGGTRTPVKLMTAQPVTLPAGGQARLYAMLPAGLQVFQNIQLELNEPPDGITLTDVTASGVQVQGVLRADPAKVKAGLRTNLMVTVYGQRVPPANAQGAAAPRRVPIAVLPAIAIEIVR